MQDKHLPSYPKIWHVGHRAVQGLFDGPVRVQEKVDGSQISFVKRAGKLYARSKGAMLVEGVTPDDEIVCDGMFEAGVRSILDSFGRFPDDVVYRGEYLSKPKHNTLSYERVPVNHIVIFDIQVEEQWVQDPKYFHNLASLMGFETIPTCFTGEIASAGELDELMETTSFLGGTTIEGVVIKAHDRMTPFGDPMFAKYVSEAFKERHSKDWKQRNPRGKDAIANLIAVYRTDARWEKAIQHMRDAGKLENDARDIGGLMKELAEDFITECKDEVLEELWKAYGKQVVRGIQGGFPEWYKRRLMESAFDAPIPVMTVPA